MAARSGHLLIAGPNLTIDRTAAVGHVTPGAILRTGPVAVTPGGKGVNVVRTATRLGMRARLVGFAAGRLGDALLGMLEDEGVAVLPVRVAGEQRSSLILTDDDGRVTVVNEPGPLLDSGDWPRYESRVAEQLAWADCLLCSGSVPPGAPADGYARLVDLARRSGVTAFVDASGPHLAASLAACPDAVLPNLAEAEALAHRSPVETIDAGADARARALLAARDLRSRGARVAVVTAGAAGAASVDGRAARWVPAPAVAVRNPIGAGDAFAAGYAAATTAGSPPAAAVRYAVAVAAAAVEVPLAGAVDPRRAYQLGARSLAPGGR